MVCACSVPNHSTFPSPLVRDFGWTKWSAGLLASEYMPDTSAERCRCQKVLATTGARGLWKRAELKTKTGYAHIVFSSTVASQTSNSWTKCEVLVDIPRFERSEATCASTLGFSGHVAAIP